jgi:hypothetical protein
MVAGAMVKKWECLDSDIRLHFVAARRAGETSAFIGFRRAKLAEAARKSHIPDFSNWQPPAAFARAFAPPPFHFGATSRLEKDLRTSTS